MELQDLVVLIYNSPNTAYVRVVRPENVDGLELDLDEETWAYRHWKENVGDGRFLRRHTERYGVIGVYNARDIGHIANLIGAVSEFYQRQGNTICID
ncbi:hypothetical protein K8R33_04580 [archaeon]|nr:hypothetical protein [archaeon]